MRVYHYRGINRRGARVVGQTAIDPTSFTVARFNLGWRELWVADEDGIVVAAIGRPAESGPRTWWSESAVPA